MQLLTKLYFLCTGWTQGLNVAAGAAGQCRPVPQPRYSPFPRTDPDKGQVGVLRGPLGQGNVEMVARGDSRAGAATVSAWPGAKNGLRF